jgi:hypothetical protein
MLQGYAVPPSPEGAVGLATTPPWHYAGDVLAIEFWSDPDAPGATLPDGLTPEPDTNGHEEARGGLPDAAVRRAEPGDAFASGGSAVRQRRMLQSLPGL